MFLLVGKGSVISRDYILNCLALLIVVLAV